MFGAFIAKEKWPPTAVSAVPGQQVAEAAAALRLTGGVAEEASDRTRVTVTTEPHGETTTHEVQAFVRERAGMTNGWSGSFDALETLLAPVGAV